MNQFTNLQTGAPDWITVTQGVETTATAYWPSDGVGGTTATVGSSLNVNATAVAVIGIVCNKINAGDVVSVQTTGPAVFGKQTFTILATDRYIPIGIIAKAANIGFMYTSASAGVSYTLLYKRL